MGPVVRYRMALPPAAGNCPVPGTRPPEGLCPNTPLKKAGMRMEPPMSEPRPKGDAPEPTIAPSPPLLPPTMRPTS